jgi:two-component system, sporulation sensor kinase D
MKQNTSLVRWVFIVASAIIVSLILWNTLAFFNELKENERQKMKIFAEAFKEVSSSTILINSTISKISTEAIRLNNTTPMISFSHADSIYNSKNIDDTILKSVKKRDALIAEFTSEYKPLQLKYNGKVFQTVYYGNSPLINKLKYYPAILIAILMLFVAAIYYFNETAKSSIKNKLWAGMAKETAHQIGTPLSSLVGWTEILRDENVNPEYIFEMEKDIKRLETITARFSKVGSKPKLTETDIVAETSAAFDYLKSRSSKLINFKIDTPSYPIYVQLNGQLFGWTIENLVKNGIDAMRGKGDIEVIVETTQKRALIFVSDTGKGIPKRNHKRIFTTGFTSKKRGWGLGLSLAKRIIHEYHNGTIRVLKSTQDKGTTFVISLPLINNS